MKAEEKVMSLIREYKEYIEENGRKNWTNLDTVSIAIKYHNEMLEQKVYYEICQFSEKHPTKEMTKEFIEKLIIKRKARIVEETLLKNPRWGTGIFIFKDGVCTHVTNNYDSSD